MNLRAPDFLPQLAALVALEESVYRAGHRNNYFAGRFALDVLTDTTERSPTYCTPPFRKFDDATAADSWAFLFRPEADTRRAWERLLKRPPQCVEWSADEVRALVGPERLAQTLETIRGIKREDLMHFRIGQDGLARRPFGPGDSAVAVVSGSERELLSRPDGFVMRQLEAARSAEGRAGLMCFGGPFGEVHEMISESKLDCVSVFVPVPQDPFLLQGVTRVAVKLVLNALSTCTMVRLGRVMGNTMIWVVPGNLKLIDRATRYVQKLAGLDYAEANRLLFEVIEYVEPRMKADQAYPPVVGLAVMRARHGVDNDVVEQRLLAELGG